VTWLPRNTKQRTPDQIQSHRISFIVWTDIFRQDVLEFLGRVFPSALRWILFAGAIHSAIYVFMVPPWQHYDEPGQFEFAWIVAHHPGLPRPGDSDPAVDRAIALSMQSHHFGAYTNSGYPLLGTDTPAAFGGSQVDWQAGYYAVASLPLRLLRDTPIEIQLYAARLVSMCMLLLTLVISYHWMCEWTAEGSRLRWIVPWAMAWLPSFVDNMSSVNNDAGATLGVTAVLWLTVRLARKGFSLRLAGVAALIAAMCVWIKVTAFVAVPILFIGLILSIARGRYRKFGFGFIAAMACIGLVALMGWGDALNWTRKTDQSSNTRMETSEAPWGKAAFYFNLVRDHPLAILAQSLPFELKQSDMKASFTMGGWVWCSLPLAEVKIGLSNGYETQFASIFCATKPQFVALVIPPFSSARNIWIDLMATRIGGDSVEAYCDGLVLVHGIWPTETPPVFHDASAQEGIWGGRQFSNLIRNPSAEFAGPRMNAWADQWHFWNMYPSSVLQSAIDLPGAWNYFLLASKTIFRSFWAVFAWGGIFLLGGSYPYYFLAGLTALGALGMTLFFCRKPCRFLSAESGVIGLAILMVWGLDVLRGVSSLVDFLVIPVARYTFPVLLPVMSCLAVGWREIGWRARVPVRIGNFLWILLPIVFAIYALWSQAAFYASFL
jgi:hypothetical protein